MLNYPSINPIALQLGPLAIHWYGCMYLLGIVSAWGLAHFRAKQSESGWTAEQVRDLIFYVALGVIIGGRVGYVIFYDLPYYMTSPASIFKLWEGGMSFHGGFIGVLISLWCFSRKVHKSIWDLTDFIAPLVPLGLAAGRIGNFINQELWGRITDVPWGMIFPNAGPEPRHASQLYECCLEGMLLFAILWWFSSKPRPRFAVSAVFLIGYGSARFIAEFFRQPDPQYGFIAFNWVTMGQVLSLPMIMWGVIALYRIYGKKIQVVRQQSAL